jgi:radical SAM-linked protein
VRLRIRSTKLGKVRFVGHRDLARIWDRALRRVGLPVTFSAGFTPRPKISFGLALPTGAESLAEYLDVEVEVDPPESPVDLLVLIEQLSAVLPVGIDAVAVGDSTSDVGSLQESVTSCTWELWAPQLAPADIAGATRLLDAEQLPIERERKGERRTDDIRPLLLDLRPDASGHRLVAELATVGRALRPAELATIAFPQVDPLDVRALRTHQWISHHGDRREVLSLPAGVHALDRTVSA